MKSLSSIGPVIASVLLMGALSGCATGQAQQNVPFGTGAAGPMAKMGPDEMAMCNMHQRMMSAKTPEERRTLMAEHMKSMPPEMRQKHMEMMRENMKMMQDMMQAPAK